MEKGKIGLIAAMPEETGALLRRVTAPERGKLCGFKACHFAIGTREVFLVESGMGPERAAAAARALIEATAPELVINFGFAGAVTAGLAVGDIVVAERILSWGNGSFQEQQGLDAGLAGRSIKIVEAEFRGKDFRLFPGTFITAAGIIGKREVAGLLPPGVAYPVLEMETAAVAQAAAEGNVPLIAIRAISDDAGEELGFSIDELTDREMNVSLGKVLVTVAKRPAIVPQLLRLARNSRLAGESLAGAVHALVGRL
jgi:adenosylhomocysteine nucleosidase